MQIRELMMSYTVETHFDITVKAHSETSSRIALKSEIVLRICM